MRAVFLFEFIFDLSQFAVNIAQAFFPLGVATPTFHRISDQGSAGFCLMAGEKNNSQRVTCLVGRSESLISVGSTNGRPIRT
jgi:hypothetical protein